MRRHHTLHVAATIAPFSALETLMVWFVPPVREAPEAPLNSLALNVVSKSSMAPAVHVEAVAPLKPETAATKMPPAGKSMEADWFDWLRNDVAVSYGVADGRLAAHTATPTAELADATATDTVPVVPDVTGADVIHSVVFVRLMPVPMSATFVQACPATVTELTAGGLPGNVLVFFVATATMRWRDELGVPSATLLNDGAEPVPDMYAWNGTVCVGPESAPAARRTAVRPGSMALTHVLDEGREDDRAGRGQHLVLQHVLGARDRRQRRVGSAGEHPGGRKGQRARRRILRDVNEA